MKKLLILAAAAFLALAAALPAAAEIDLSTGLTATPAAPAPALQRDGASVLWDMTHGVYFQYQPAGDFSQMVAALEGAGHTLTTTDLGVDNIDLSPYKIIIICLGSNWYSPYTASEVEALLDFHAAGGALFVIGENVNCPNENLAPLLSAFNCQAGLSSTGDVTVTNFASSDDFFIGVNSIVMAAAGPLSVSFPVIEQAWTDQGELVVAKEENCGLALVGDFNIFDNIRLQTADNRTFLLNIMDCLQYYGTVATEEATLEGVKAIYR